MVERRWRLEPEGDRGQSHEGEIVRCELLVACGDAAEPLQEIDQPFHPIALTVQLAVKASLRRLIPLARDHGSHSPAPQVAPDLAAAVALVPDHTRGAPFGASPARPLHHPLFHEWLEHTLLLAPAPRVQGDERLFAALPAQVGLCAGAAPAPTTGRFR